MRTLFFLLLLVVARAEMSPTDYIQQIVDLSYPRGVRNTGSMKPTFDEHFYILIIPPAEYPFEKVRAGDIILYWGFYEGKSALICHRVIAISSGRSVAILKGDANAESDDGLIRADQYAGFVVGYVRRDVELPPRPEKVVRFLLDPDAKDDRVKR